MISQRAVEIVGELEAIQASRVLTDEESRLLERSLRRLGPKRDIWRWSEKDDRRLLMLIKRRGRLLRVRPFQHNDEIQRIAEEMRRSYFAVHKRIQRLRAKHGLPKQPLMYDTAASGRTSRASTQPLDFTGTLSPEGAVVVLRARHPRVSLHWLQYMRKMGGGPPFVKIGRFVRYPESGVHKYPVEQIMDEAESRRIGWLGATMRMDPEYCPSAKKGGQG